MMVEYLERFSNKVIGMAINQTYLFMVFSLVGIIIGILFDIFRILRKTFKTKDFITYIEDITFWVITGIIILVAMYVFCDGQLRFFMILGIVLGTILYMVTFSRYVIKVSIFIINIVKKIIIYPIRLVIGFARKIVFKPIVVICINFRKNIVEFVKKVKKYRGFFEKKEKYNNI